MKAPKYLANGKQEQLKGGLNAFALELVAESYGDDPTRFKGESILCINRAHNGNLVYILISSVMPTAEDFDKPEEQTQDAGSLPG
jgi:hypothetical protein